VAAKEACAIFEQPANAERLLAVQKESAGDIGKFFMMVIPVAVELVGSVIAKYGFEPSQSGAMEFVKELRRYEADGEIKALADNLKTKFMPNMMPAAPVDEMAD